MIYTLCNLYAPTKDHKLDQNNFTELIKNKLAPFETDNIILSGDLNIYLDPQLAKMDNMSNKNDNPFYRKEIHAVMEAICLTDFFMDLYPNIRWYTWHARGKSSCPYYWLISEHLSNQISSYNILPGLHSDHCILKLNIGINKTIRGKGYWKFNISLLHDPNYINEIKKIIQECEKEYDNLEDRGYAWEMKKPKIRSFFCSFLYQIKIERLEFKNLLEKH